MREQSDDLVQLIHAAAGQVRPLDGIDGETMAGRAIRRERVRRGVIGGAVAIVLVALGAAGTIWPTERPLLPALLPWVQGPSAETEVRSDGLIFEVPAGFEEFTLTGDPMWGLDPVIPDEQDMDSNASAASWVAVELVEDPQLVGELVGNPVAEADVPGAVAARWSWYSAEDVSVPGYWERGPGDGDFVGERDVERGTGTVVRLTMSLTDDDTPQNTFERLVRTVRVDEDLAGPEEDVPPRVAQEDLPLLEATDAPGSWERADFHGLRYAVPGDWQAVGEQGAEHLSDTLRLRRPDGKVELRMELDEHLMYLDNAEMAAEYAEVGEELNYYRFDLAGADVSQVMIDRSDTAYQAYIEVRRAGGKSYKVNLFGSRGVADLDEDLAATLGSLGFTAASTQRATAYDALDPADPLLQDPPSDWRPVEFEGLRLRLPQDLRSDDGSWGIWNDHSADSWQDLSIGLWDLDAYEQPFGLDENGYRYEPPGTTRGVAAVGTDDETGEYFQGTATIWLTADGRKSVEVSYEGPGATEERWWQILASLDATDLTGMHAGDDEQGGARDE